ncbi:MAG: ABC transporter permease, partial [Solirubrobacteraceae bacterium]
QLFKNKSSLGQKIVINNLFFTVVGVFENNLNELEEQKIYVSQRKFTSLFNSKDNIESFVLSGKKEITLKEAIFLKENIKNQITKNLQLNESSKSSIKISSGIEEGKDANNFLIIMNLVIIFIGLGTLLSGTIGVSNVMLYIVKDRFYEIGIRKAVGAKSKDIILLIFGETIFTMIFFGIIGIIFGTLILSLIGNNLNEYYILNPYVKYNQILIALLSMLFFGFIAGLIPAKYAASSSSSECINKNQY